MFAGLMLSGEAAQLDKAIASAIATRLGRVVSIIFPSAPRAHVHSVTLATMPIQPKNLVNDKNIVLTLAELYCRSTISRQPVIQNLTDIGRGLTDAFEAYGVETLAHVHKRKAPLANVDETDEAHRAEARPSFLRRS